MRTPGHAVINLCVLGALGAADSEGAVLAGSVLPDLPIVALWALERLRGRTDEEIWREVYPKRPWIYIIHGAHSIPLALLGLSASLALGAVAGTWFFASALLHSALDLPLHVQDAHRHFLPFSSWRYESRLSYWDVRYHGRTLTLVEALAVTGASAWLWGGASSAGRLALLVVLVWYVRSCWRIWGAAARPIVRA